MKIDSNFNVKLSNTEMKKLVEIILMARSATMAKSTYDCDTLVREWIMRALHENIIEFCDEFLDLMNQESAYQDQ